MSLAPILLTLAFGLGLVIAGGFVSGYAQDVCLQVGSAVMLVAPLIVVERLLVRRVDEVGANLADELVESLEHADGAGAAPQPDGLFAVLSARLPQLLEPEGWEVSPSRDPQPSLLVYRHGGKQVSVAVHEGALPLSKARLANLVSERGAGELVVASASGFTRASRSDSSVRLVEVGDPGDIHKLASAISDVAGPADGTRGASAPASPIRSKR